MMESFSMELRCWPRQHAPLEDNEGITSSVLHQLQQTKVYYSPLQKTKCILCTIEVQAFTICANFQLCVVLYIRVLHSACVCVLHPLQQEQERHYDIFSVSPTYNPQHANSYIYSFAYTSPCTQSIQILPAHTFILFLLHINVNTITSVR